MHTHHAVQEQCLHPEQVFCPKSESSAVCPKFNACKLVTQHPSVGWVDTSHGGLGWLDRQFQGYLVLFYVCACVCIT